MAVYNWPTSSAKDISHSVNSGPMGSLLIAPRRSIASPSREPRWNSSWRGSASPCSHTRRACWYISDSELWARRRFAGHNIAHAGRWGMEQWNVTIDVWDVMYVLVLEFCHAPTCFLGPYSPDFYLFKNTSIGFLSHPFIATPSIRSTVTHHPWFYYLNGSVIFQVEDTLYKLFCDTLEQDFHIFCDLFRFHQIGSMTEGKVDENPIVLPSLTVETFDLYLELSGDR